MFAHKWMRGLGLALALLPGCYSVASHVRRTGEVLKEYKKDGSTYYIIKSGSAYKKWQHTGSTAGITYEVDAAIQVCKSGGVVVDCESLRKDGDLARYITW